MNREVPYFIVKAKHYHRLTMTWIMLILFMLVAANHAMHKEATLLIFTYQINLYQSFWTVINTVLITSRPSEIYKQETE